VTAALNVTLFRRATVLGVALPVLVKCCPTVAVDVAGRPVGVLVGGSVGGLVGVIVGVLVGGLVGVLVGGLVGVLVGTLVSVLVGVLVGGVAVEADVETPNPAALSFQL
jgi:predicted lipid-binding transport protein (Tim44 family)